MMETEPKFTCVCFGSLNPGRHLLYINRERLLRTPIESMQRVYRSQLSNTVDLVPEALSISLGEGEQMRIDLTLR